MDIKTGYIYMIVLTYRFLQPPCLVELDELKDCLCISPLLQKQSLIMRRSKLYYMHSLTASSTLDRNHIRGFT